MPRPVLRDAQESFSGGLNLVADESRLAPNEVRRADNARLTEFGGVTHRGGTQRLSVAPIGVPNLITNPVVAVDSLGWASNAATAARDTSLGVFGGTTSMKYSMTDMASAGAVIFGSGSDTRYVVVPGDSMIYEAWVYATGGSIGKTMRLVPCYYTTGDTGGGEPDATGTMIPVALASGWNRLVFVHTVPASMTRGLLAVYTDVAEGVFDVWISGASVKKAVGITVRGGHFWLRPGSTNQLLAVSNGILHTGTYSVPMEWTQQSGSLDSTVQPAFATFRGSGADVVYIADGGALNKWNGTTLTTNIASTPNVSIIAVYNNRLYGCGDTSNPYRLYWSALQDGDTLGDVGSGGGYADIRTFAQSELTGLQPLGAGLLIFHRNGISRFTGIGIDDIDVEAGTRGVSSDVGTYSPHGIIAIENVCLFISDRGIFQVTEDGLTAVAERPGGGTNSIGDRIESVLRTIDQSSLARAVVGHNKLYHEVMFYLPDVGVYAFNYRLGAWSGPWTGIYTSTATYSMWNALDGSNVPIVLFGNADGFVRRADAPSLFKDDYLSDGTGGTVNALVVQCRRMDCQSPTVEKAYRWIFLTLNPRGIVTGGVGWQTVDTVGLQSISVSGAESTWGTGTWGSGTWGASSGSFPARVQAHGSGTYIDVTLTDDSATGALYSRVEVHAFLMGERY